MLTPKTKGNAKAAEFRARANALRAEILDETKSFTKDELDKRTTDIALFEQRAAVAAEFTPEGEIADQHRVDPDVIGRARGNLEDPDKDQDKDAVNYRSLDDQLKDLQVRAAKYFGTMRNFMRATDPSQRASLNPSQRKLIEDCAALSRVYYPEDAQQERTVDTQTRTITGGSDTSAGVLLPLQQVPNIFAVPNMLMGVLQGASRYTVTGRSLRIPYVVQTDAHGGITRPLAGIANVNIIGEGETKDTRETKYLQRLLTIYKWAAIAKIGDETLGDDFTGQLAPNVTQQVGGQVLNAMNEMMTITGDGSGEPLGALHANNPSLLSPQRQSHALIKIADVFTMFQKHTHGPKSCWLVNRSGISQLLALSLSGNTLVTFVNNLNTQPGNIASGLVGYLLGYPVYICDILPLLGTPGDFALVNPEFYAAAIRTNLTVESSIHVEFVKDITTYRFLARGGGIPIPDGTYAYKSNGTGNKEAEHSPFVRLGTASGS